MPKRGLPETVRMRHDSHYVEALTSSAGAPIGRMVGIDQIDANPNQPRQVMGDLSELMASIAEKGIIEPIIVRQRGSRFQIVAGERRYQAAVQVGLREIPIVIREVDDNEIIEVALVENLQRKDLTAFEESEVLQSLAERCRYTHEDMAKRLGKSRTAITESLSLNGMPEEVKKRLFDTFFTTKPVSKGTGLGLSIWYAIIEKHKGSMKISSEVGRGTKILISIPVRYSADNQSVA